MAQPVLRGGVLVDEVPAVCRSVSLTSTCRTRRRARSSVSMISSPLSASMAMGTFSAQSKLLRCVPSVEHDGSAGRSVRASMGEGGGSAQKAANPVTDAGRSSADSGSGSYLSMWKRARERQEQERLKKEVEKEVFTEDDIRRAAQLRREKQFESILQVPAEERDRVQRMQVVDRAAAALSAAQALLADVPPIPSPDPAPAFSSVASAPSSPLAVSSSNWLPVSSVEVRGSPLQQLGQSAKSGTSTSASPTLGSKATPGPDFWTWAPPPPTESASLGPREASSSSKLMPSVIEKDRTFDTLPLRFESDAEEEGDTPFTNSSMMKPSLPPLQSLMEISKQRSSQVQPEGDIRVPSVELEQAALHATEELKSQGTESTGVNPDGARWWKETGVEQRENGVVCNWTVIRGVSEDGSVEWEEKFWEAYDAYDYKELGAEKSGRDSKGSVWREFWKESMWQDALNGLLHMEKSADKWAKNGQGGQWHEKWWEHYDASGKAEKWADKWSHIDPSTPLEPGHAHVWHERWGENFDGQGSCTKYTDKWAERAEYGGGWTKWGDKWDERFDRNAHGVKQGETWWEGQNGERWNRTWGEGHNGSGWVHKYGKSSSGEHWDTHEEQDTWYERRPHYGFKECYDCSRELRKVGKEGKSKDASK